ncbi:zinc-binding dehydrogenase [Frankia sp. AgB1.9]|uniref:zinc-binding dehydrogenase n=1 Tax=unclassified Frankia TaxID=2632575 RepID=UPI00193259E7|nr:MULTISPECIES: zinc-binding dehydrogenase [unclassified Frankia]MBL7552990.1 zinc-binding dehydrogenase [Frankia sp. AgB1.9]MBL7624575.1 zinc-binding dehydrogenase [Frankia sp. AgB1.8]
MRAAVLRGGTVEARVVADPVPGPGQLLVRSLACGICASDLHFMDHLDAGVDDDSGMSTYDPDVDIVMGHEYCAEVVDYGPDTARRIPVGTRVSSLPVLATPTGRKIIGQNPESPGGFGEYFLITEAITRVVASDLPSEVVCVADAISVGWSAASRAQVTTSEVPLVIGCGAIALSAIAQLRRLGVGPIVAVDFVASRRATALAMGADVVVDPAEISPFQAWRDVAYGSAESMRELMALAGLPGCVVFECVGIPGVLDSIIKGCERGTRIYSVGGPPEGDHLHTLTAKRKGLNIQFGGGPSMDHWDEAFEAVCSGSLDVTPLLGRTIGLDEVADGLAAARDANGPVRIIVTPSAQGRTTA